MFPDYNSYNQYYGLNGGLNGDNNFVNNNMLNNGFDFRSNWNGGMMNMGNDEIITLSQGVQMIRKKISEGREDEEFLDKLIKLAPTDKEKDIIKQIMEDKKNHDRFLRDVHYSLTGQMNNVDFQMDHRPNRPDNPNKPDNDDKKYNEMLEELLFDKFDCVVKFRRILSVMPNGENHTLIMAILTDELKNIGKINFLIHKNK